VLGGTQSLHANARDEAMGLSTEDSVRLALRTQQIIAYETGVSGVSDPLGGSFCIEELTNRIESAALDYIRRIDEMGGALQAIEAGFIQAEIQSAAYEHQREVESGERVIVGVNRFRMDRSGKTPVFRINPEIESAQILSVQAVRSQREPGRWSRCLKELEAAARGAENLMPRILAAAEAYATVGEISDTLRVVFGEYREAS
jgi:methylmalonyl-CoA mutase N-terminal domain/subunit